MAVHPQGWAQTGQKLDKTSMCIILTVFFMLPLIVHFLCQLQLPQHSSSSSIIITTSFLPHWNSAWHTGAAHCWHRAQRERPKEGLDQNQRRSSCAPSIVSAKHSFSLVDQGTRKSSGYFPASASCKKNQKKSALVWSSVGSRGCCVCVCSGICWLIYVFMWFALGEE